MSKSRSVNRRDFLSCAGLGAAALLTDIVPTALSASAATFATKGAPSGTRSTFFPDVEIALKATAANVPLLSGEPTRVWTYQGTVLQGDPASLQSSPNTYLGPTIRVGKNQNVRINFTNNLLEPSVMHWHGLHVSPEMDAHPRYVIGPGSTYVYEFKVTNRAGTYWYHPHPDGHTGPQVYQGLAGLLYVSDEEEAALGLPSGDYDLPLVIQDRTFDASNQLVYSRGGMMSMDGFLGNRILVNGQPNFILSVATRAYRLRLLNGSNSRIYKLAWNDGTPLTVIATDGGLLEAPVERSYVMLAPGERVEMLADYSQRPVGTRLRMVSLAFSGADSGSAMGGGRMGGSQSLSNGAPFPVLDVQVTRSESETFVLPVRLSTINRYPLQDAVNSSDPRVFAISSSMMRWLLNGRTFELEGVADNEIVQLNTLEAWDLVNQANSGGMMGGMRMAHPLHIHGLQFQVIEREIQPLFASGWETVRHGYVDEGWKDTVLLMPGERARLLLKFEDFPGLYVYHCHNLEHEDTGMMRNYLVRA